MSFKVNGFRNGKGKEYFYGKLSFDGEYSYEQRIGKGIEYNDNNIKIFEGEYLNGKKHGKCKEYTDKGTLSFEGEYLNGEINSWAKIIKIDI